VGGEGGCLTLGSSCIQIDIIYMYLYIFLFSCIYFRVQESYEFRCVLKVCLVGICEILEK